MSASHADLRRPTYAVATLCLSALVCVAALSVRPALGQGVQPSPVTLVPRNVLRVIPAPETATLAAPEPSGFAPSAPDLSGQGRQGIQGSQGVQGIEINRLDEIPPEAIGTLGPEDGGFGIDMWRGTSRGVIEGLLQRLPAHMSSRAMRDLTRRLLLSVAPPPAGKPAALASATLGASGLTAQDSAMPVGLLVLRARLLAGLGEVPAVVSLLSVVPGHVAQESLERLYVEALFLSHERDEACRRVGNAIAVYHELPFWQKSMAFCNMAGGDLDRGMLGLDLLREQGLTDDPLYFALANRFIGAKGPLPAADSLTPLHIAMLHAAEAPLPTGALEGAGPGLLYAMATDPNLTPAERSAAAVRACAQGIIDGAALAQGYQAMSFDPEQLGNALSAVTRMDGPAAHALLYQAIQGEALPATRAEVLRVALDMAKDDALYPAAVALYGPLIGGIEAVPQLTWFAPTAGRMLYATGRHDLAGDWLTLGRQESLINSQGSAAVAALWPFSRLAGGDSVTTQGDLASWLAMREAAGATPPDGAIALLRVLFQALGETDSLSWVDIAARRDPAGRPMPDAAFLYALEDASEARRVGETVLLSLILLGDAGPVGAHGRALGAAVSALSRIGLENEARALAIEAALGNGV